MKIFISYAHKDEELKNDLLVMVKGIERRNIIKIWHDRKIEPGQAWREAIQNAMKTCEMGLLLISPDFIASDFIHNVELRELLKRRAEGGLLVIPIILRDCLWKSELGLGEIQALPQDAKPVITFRKDTGERDAAWTKIAEYIEQKATNNNPDSEPEPIKKGTAMPSSHLTLMQEKIEFLKQKLVLETDASTIFKLNYEIAELERNIKK